MKRISVLLIVCLLAGCHSKSPIESPASAEVPKIAQPSANAYRLAIEQVNRDWLATAPIADPESLMKPKTGLVILAQSRISLTGCPEDFAVAFRARLESLRAIHEKIPDDATESEWLTSSIDSAEVKRLNAAHERLCEVSHRYGHRWR